MMMSDSITKAEAVVFATAIHSVLDKVQPVIPSAVITIVASKVDFSADDLPDQVRQAVADLKESDPVMTKPPVGAQHDQG